MRKDTEITDTYHDSLEKALDQAKWEFGIEVDEWQEPQRFEVEMRTASLGSAGIDEFSLTASLAGCVKVEKQPRRQSLPV